MVSVATESAGASDRGALTERLLRYRSHVAAVLAIVVVVGLLAALESLSVPLEAGETLRLAGSAAIAGDEPTYTAYSGLWLGLRALLGAYIVFVVLLISALALVVWKEVLG